MFTPHSTLRTLTLTIAAAALISLNLGAAANASNVCPPLDSGKVDVSGSYAALQLTAPDGYAISSYCVKAGSEQSDAGLEYVTVDPPTKTVTITHSSGKDISHWAASYAPDPQTTTTTTEAPPETTTTVPETTTTVPEEVTTTTEVPETTTTEPPTETPEDPEDELPLTGPGDLLPIGIAGAAMATLGALALRATRLDAS